MTEKNTSRGKRLFSSVQNYFTYSTSERNGFLVILVLILIVIGGISVVDYLTKDDTKFEEIDLGALLVPLTDSSAFIADSEPEPFPFDPNNLDREGWERLGFSKKQATSIINYKKKAGDFQRATDLLKLFVIDSSRFRELEPFIQLSNHSVQEFKEVKININSAGIEEWKALPGIGEKRASKILNFKELLGGFSSIEQVGETYGIDSVTFQGIRHSLYLTDNSWSTLNINQASSEDLARHPYISKKLAEDIVLYRKNVGLFPTPNDLVNMGLISANLYVKLQPYLAVNEH